MTIRANFSGSAGVFVGRIQIAAALLPMIFGASGCRTPAPIVRRPSIETGSLGVREFSGEDRFQGYLAKLSVIEAERRAYEREKWRRLIRAGIDATPGSTVAFDAEMKQLAIADVADLSSYTPNLEIATAVESIVVSGEQMASGEKESITNNQEVGVDEGDIVKRIGEYVLLLRRGRLFSFAIGTSAGSPLRLVDRIDLPPQLPPDNREIDAWYDEMLVSGSKVVVIGYNFGGGAVEIEVFDLSAQGQFSRVDTIFISSFDYFDGSNYASRLVGGDLILYAPLEIRSDERLRVSGDSMVPTGAIPTWPMRVFFSPEGEITGITPLVFDSRIFVGVQSVEQWPVLHTMLRCPLGDREFRCTAVGILGPESEAHYMSKSAFYLWLTADNWILDLDNLDPDDYRDLLAREDGLESDAAEKSVIYRIPLDPLASESPVGAVEVRGSPTDQFAFRESESTLDVFAIEELSESSRALDAGHETAVGHLIEFPLAAFQPSLVPWNEIPSQELPVEDASCVVNRFVGDHLIYADCQRRSNDSVESSRLRIAKTGAYSPPWEIELGYDVQRIEKVGELALITGATGYDPDRATHSDSWLSVLDLEDAPMIVDEIAVSDRLSDAWRSHAFNFAPLGNRTIMALPLDLVPAGLPNDDDEPEFLTEIHYFQLADDLRITSMGAILQSPDSHSIRDDCRASCDDWYGSARPFFIGPRIFGLIDYELIEAEAIGGRLREVQRASAIADWSE